MSDRRGPPPDDLPLDAPGVEPSPDRARKLAIAGASMLVAVAVAVAVAGGVGFGIGRSVDHDDVAIAPADTVSDASVTSAPASRSLSPAEEPAEEPAAEAGVSYDVASSYWVPTPMETLYERTTESGVRIRLQGGQRWNESWTEGDWTAAGYCLADREARVTFDSDDLVDIGGASLYPELFRGLQVEAGETGWADDHVVRYLVVQADTATEVAVSWDDGLADRTPTSGGFAVLAVEPTTSDGDVWNMDYTLEVVEPDGVREFGRDDLEYWDDVDYQAGCNPPLPGLPEPGEQPADPVAAERALRERFALLWDHDVPRDQKRSLLDDWNGVDVAADAVVAGEYSAAAETAGHEIDEIVFTGPTTAWFRYTLYTDISDFTGRYGTAELVGGEWRFTRDLMCQDLALGGGDCGGGWESIRPPSWYERYGESVEMPAIGSVATIVP